MSIKVIGSDAKIHTLSNSFNGLLSKEHGILYVGTKGLGQVTRDTAAGLTPGRAFEERYNGMKSAMTGDFIADDLFVFDTIHGEDYDYDDGVRKLINELYVKGKVPFNANVGTIQKENTNSEALISYDREKHLDILVSIIKQYFGLELFFDTKDSIIWRFKQEEDIEEIFERLIQYRLCLYAAYTSRGKTKIGIEVAVRLCQQGGIVLVTTPITDTKKSFEENINDFHFGNDRGLKVTFMDSIEFAKHSVADLRQRANDGELVFVVLTVQDLRYGEDSASKVDADTKELRKKYHALSGEVNLWIRDERHAQYSGEVTSQRLANMTAEYELDLTATPYNVLDKYDWEQIVSRTLLWGLKYREHTKLPTIRIDAVSTPLSNVSPKIAAMYSEEEGFDPRKLFIRDNGKFVLESELLDIRDCMYHSVLSKKKNPLSIANDTELSVVAKNCGFWVLPEGQDGDGAADYIPDLAALLNTNSKTYFTDSYTLEKECPKTTTIGKYIESLGKQHSRVVILTCGKFLTGTDIPALGHIVLMSRMNNIANFEQLLGRMIREYPSKDEVKMYCFAPAMEIGLTMGRMAKMNAVALNGGTEYEMLECIPLTEYTSNGPQKISPYTILTEVQEFLKNRSKDRLPSASLENRLYGMDLSMWEGKDTKKFKKFAPKAGVTEDNGAKVKNKLGIDPDIGNPRSKEELNTITQIANAIQTVMVEAKWVAYSINNYDYHAVLSNSVLAEMFPEEIDAIIDTIEDDIVIREMVIKNLNDKQLAYKGLMPIDVYDDIFMNNEYKKNIGLVYVNFAMAKELVDNLPKSKYNKEGAVIAVFNALSGTIPLLLKERFPKARIVCIEYFEYFKDHLSRLGCEVIGIAEDEDGKLYLEDDDMKFDVIVGNPPYQDPTGQNTIYPKFYAKAISVCKPNGYIAMITPPAIIPGLWGVKDPDGIKMPEPIQIKKIKVGNVVKDFFPGVASDFCYFILKNVSPNNSKVTVVTDSGEVVAAGPIFPREVDNVVIAQSILNRCFSFYKDPYKSTSGDHGKSAKFDPNGKDLAVESISTTGNVRTRPITWIKQHDHYNKPKVIMPMYGKVAVVDYSHKLVSAGQEKTATGKLTGHNIMTVLTNSDAESESLMQILESRLQRFFNTVTCETRSPYVNFLKNFIGVPLTNKYTNDKLETALGLTPEEKEWISANF